MRAGREEVLDEIILLVLGRGLARLHPDDALAAAFLRAVGAHGGAFDEAAVGHRDDAAFVGDEVLDVDLAFVGNDLREARSRVFGFDLAEFGLDDFQHALLAREDVQKVRDGGKQLFVFAQHLVALHSGELVKAKLEDVVDLLLGEEVFAVGQALLAADLDAEFFDLLAGELEREQFDLGFLARLRVADDADELIEVGERDEERLEFLGAGFGLAEQIPRAAQDHLAAVVDVARDGVLERKQLRLAVVDGQHGHRERTFQRRVFVEVVDDDLRVGVTLQLDHNARVFVRFVADGADVRDRLLVDEIGDALDEGRAVDVVGDLGDDELLAVAFEFLDADLAADFHRAAPGFQILFDTGHAAELASRREIRAFDVLHQAVERDVGLVDLGADGIDDLAEIVRRHVGGHAHGDAGAAIDEKVRERRREDDGFGQALVVVGDKIHRGFVHVGHQCRAEVGEPRLGVTHGGRWIAFDRAEIALTVHQSLAHRPVLRHVHEGGVDHHLAVRMVVAARVAADLGALDVLPPREQPQIMHRIEDAALGGLESVARIGQRAGDDDGHGVVEEGA